MTPHIRAEDFDIVADQMILGGRVIQGGAILSTQIERRVSLELLGYAVAIAGCVAIALTAGLSAPSVLVLGLAVVLALGANREIKRPYVLVMNLFQIGLFEVRGFTSEEMEVVHDMLDQLRRGGAGVAGPMSATSGVEANW